MSVTIVTRCRQRVNKYSRAGSRDKIKYEVGTGDLDLLKLNDSSFGTSNRVFADHSQDEKKLTKSSKTTF
jgi:hypothetical protein